MSRELWEFKYAPTKFEDMVLNDNVRPSLKEALDKRPNMLIHGTPGVGKGTYVEILKKYNDLDNLTLKINASDDTGIDAMRDKVKSFATAMSVGKMKLVYLNEADSLTSGPQGSQKMLRDLMEATQTNTQFILVLNYIHLVIPEILSRCQVFNISAPPAIDIFKHCKKILIKENIEFSNDSLIGLVKKCYPDVRNTIITLQQNVVDGALSENLVESASEQIYKQILDNMTKDPGEVRKILKSNSIHYDGLYEFLYQELIDTEGDLFDDDGSAIIHMGEAAYRNNIVANKEINFMSTYFKMLGDGSIKL